MWKHTHDTPTRPKYKSPVFGNKYIRHTYKTQIFTGRRHVETYTTQLQDLNIGHQYMHGHKYLQIKPKYRSPVHGNTYTRHLQRPEYRSPVCTNRYTQTPTRPEYRSAVYVQIDIHKHLQDPNTGHWYSAMEYFYCNTSNIFLLYRNQSA